MKFATPTAGKLRRDAAFTLAEVLAALMFMAIVIPVAVEALHISSLSGEVATRKAAAARVADKVLNESLVMTNWTSSVNGTVSEGGYEFRYSLETQNWPQDSSMQLLTAEVKFTAGGRECAVRLNTLAHALSGSSGGMAASQ